MTRRAPLARGPAPARPPKVPRLAFLGLGWIGRARLEALAASGAGEPVALVDPDAERLAEAARHAPRARRLRDLDELLALDLDGLVIATPSALHAPAAGRALAAGLAVFCQKPLARTAAETRAVVAAAERADRLLAVDLSYRHLVGLERARELLAAGSLGRPFAGRFVFHNAYGPDKPWFRDPALSGGGCVIDLGTHLVDLALQLFGAPVERVSARLFAAGRAPRAGEVEDHALARLDLAGGAVCELACSWWLPAGRQAVIEATVYGERGGVSIRNLAGSFHDFETVALEGTRERVLAREDGAWGGKAIVAWARALAAGARFDPRARELVAVADVVDRIYGR